MLSEDSATVQAKKTITSSQAFSPAGNDSRNIDFNKARQISGIRI
jgi:hypothetical protein